MFSIDSINDIEDIITNEDGTYTIKYKVHKSKSGSRLVKASWKEVPHFDKKGNQLSSGDYKKTTVAKNGKKYFAQTEECEFLGSSSTLISTEALKLMTPEEPIAKDTIFAGIKIYSKPIPGHNYLLSVDPSKDGIDSFSVQVTDITKFPFIQVASAKLDVDYLMMPESLESLGLYYNEAFIIIENNEGAGQSIADMLFLTYEYPNMYRDRDTNDKKYKKFYGFRTTKKTRPLILNMLKIFIEEGKLIVQDKSTIDEFSNFIKGDGLKYEAEEGYHDDMIMSLALLFAPFMQIKAFDDLEMFLGALRIDIEDDEGVETADYYSLLDVGGFSDGNAEDSNSREAILDRINNSFDDDEKFTSLRELNNMSQFG